MESHSKSNSIQHQEEEAGYCVDRTDDQVNQACSEKNRPLPENFVRRLPGSPDDFTGSPDDFTGSPDDFVRRLLGSPDDFLEAKTTLSEDFQEVQTTSRRLPDD
ncbi:hypothetical protein F2Q69_00055115 [Brassica cretica]|uniref:Uncharacterized protein n=1 Tax=Brassica cretica TaxID=69181 RepID=A0A8S9MVK3_BRACR|nr:hypothetical protein F2Q69_00055115 [Brassica cretica]